ncbi:Protein of unknown function DUF6, transmembrane [gamma proteobacterium HdN1]|nr:Protein of unknown function DUF6, transmembrane [gamma proteobacterium HdN1]
MRLKELASLKSSPWRADILLALVGVYVIWGSTYLAMRFAIESMPPLLMAGVRYISAGALMLAFLRWRGHAWPSGRQWINGGIIGAFLMLGGNGMVGLALEQGVSSGMSALVVGVAPLFALAFANIWGSRARIREWVGMVIGFGGLILLNLGNELSASPLGASLLVLAALTWAFGSMWSQHLNMPAGFMASAVEMLLGGFVLLAASALRGETVTEMPTAKAWWALGYLISFGAILGFSAYVHLLQNVRPAIATSYAYVNPLVAVGLGVWLAGEQVDRTALFAMAIILSGVVLVYWPSRERAPDVKQGAANPDGASQQANSNS